MSSNCLNYDTSKPLNYDQQSNLQDDQCYVQWRMKNSQKPGNYMLNNYHSCDCTAPANRNLALSQPTVNFQDGYGWTSINGCNIDADSKLRLNPAQLTNKNCKTVLNTRPYNTVPYMGRGVGNPKIELQLKEGTDTYQSRPCLDLTEENLTDYSFTPLVPNLKKNIQNPAHLIPEVADKGWVRGGIPSRLLIQDSNYLQQCGYPLPGKSLINN
tara:strand:- start:420 stop:1058 length:639 start_codon:yes stop_codon:yes gene_type:complete